VSGEDEETRPAQDPWGPPVAEGNRNPVPFRQQPQKQGGAGREKPLKQPGGGADADKSDRAHCRLPTPLLSLGKKLAL